MNPIPEAKSPNNQKIPKRLKNKLSISIFRFNQLINQILPCKKANQNIVIPICFLFPTHQIKNVFRIDFFICLLVMLAKGLTIKINRKDQNHK
jgi:hypothetical protein